jgi:hypothetical protein
MKRTVKGTRLSIMSFQQSTCYYQNAVEYISLRLTVYSGLYSYHLDRPFFKSEQQQNWETVENKNLLTNLEDIIKCHEQFYSPDSAVVGIDFPL